MAYPILIRNKKRQIMFYQKYLGWKIIYFSKMAYFFNQNWSICISSEQLINVIWIFELKHIFVKSILYFWKKEFPSKMEGGGVKGA